MKRMLLIALMALSMPIPLFAQFDPSAWFEKKPDIEVKRLLGTSEHLFTTSVEVENNFKNKFGYRDEGVAGNVFRTHEKGTYPLFRFFDGVSGDNGLAAAPDRIKAFLAAGYSQEEMLGYVYIENHPKMSPLYELQIDGVDMFYTASSDELQSVLNNDPHAYVGICCYISFGDNPQKAVELPRELKTAPLSKLAKSNRAPLKLFVLITDITGLADHYWTCSEEEAKKLSMNPKYRYEGIAGTVLKSFEPGAIPVESFYYSEREDQAFASDEIAKSALLKAGFKETGVAFYLFSAKIPGTRPFIHFYDIADNCYAADPNGIYQLVHRWKYIEKETVGYMYY